MGEGGGEGNVTATTAPTITSQYGPRPDSEFGTATLFIKTKDSQGQDTVAYYHHDHLGVPLQATDRSGNIVWSAQYAAFGRATVTTPTATQDKPTIESNLRFPGQVEDAETGLYYNWHRYYDPDIGRYVTADPVGLAGGINLYAYVGGNPVNGYDPSGEWIIPAIRGVMALCARYPKACAAVVASVTGYLMDVGIQLYQNDGNWECVDQKEALIAGGTNAILGAGIGSLLKWGSKLKWFKKPVINGKTKSFRDQMTPEEAARYDKSLNKHAPEQSSPYNTHNRYNEDGSLKQTTTYNQYGRRHRQYDVNDGRRAEHQHNFEYSSDYPKGTRSDHLPIDE